MRKRIQFSLDMLTLDADAETALHRQLYNELTRLILSGKLKANTRLPSSRTLADELHISRNTVIAAYDALLAEGYVECRSGSGTWISDLPEPTKKPDSQQDELHLPQLSRRGNVIVRQPKDQTVPGQIAFHPGFPDIREFPFSTWARLLKRHARYPHEEIFGYHSLSGHPRLQTAIANYLGVSRGVECTPSQVIIVTGAQSAFDLCARLLLDEGDAFCYEEPGYSGAFSAMLAAGGVPIPLYVNRDGWSVRTTFEQNPRLFFVTPSCQWPMGLAMRLENRLELLNAAENLNAWIIEDDYDGEYRYRGKPIPAMQGLDKSGTVLYVGTFGKTMFPALRIGFVVVPARLSQAFDAAVSITGKHPPLLLQATLADFIEEGFFAKHLAKMRRIYAERQAEFVGECNAYLGEWLSVEQIDTGMQVVGRFKMPMSDLEFCGLAAAHAVDVSPLSPHYRHSPPEQGIIMGYTGVGATERQKGLERLRAAFQESLRSKDRGCVA
ncbi:rhizopine catabolism transcriptional regulator MocR|nr:PLP-dependent aminotransferase family protein [Rhizobium altiplani]